MLSESEIEKQFSRTLDCKIVVSVSDLELEISELSDGEKIQFSKMKHEARQKSWLRGRSALRTVVRRAGLSSIDCDTSKIKMPHPHLSLSHSGSLAVAVARPQGFGIGVDIEYPREVREGASRFFLAAASEQKWLSSLGDSANKNEDLLRLWTTKESLFKADLFNKDKTLNCYAVIEPDKHTGLASLFDDIGVEYRYSSLKLEDYWLTLSIACGA